MRINILANAPWGNTAYSNIARTFGPRLLRAGHSVSMTALWGLQGGMVDWCGIPVYPKAVDGMTRDVQAAHAKHYRADLFMSWCDIFMVDPRRLETVGLKWSPWFPVDSTPVSPPLVGWLEAAQWPLVYSRFGLHELQKAGVENARYVPVGIETDVFKPRDRVAACKAMGLPADRYIVGMVQANSERKALPQQILGFAEFQKSHPDALLYIHTFSGDQSSGVDVIKVCEMCGLEVGRDVVLSGQHAYLTNLYGDDAMVNLYNAFDVLLSVTRGEGFGVPIIEAAACGTPAIVGDWSSMSELNFSGLAHPIEEATPVWNKFETWWQLPRPAVIADLLDEIYRKPRVAQSLRTLALDYDADKVTADYLIPLLSEIEGESSPVSFVGERVMA